MNTERLHVPLNGRGSHKINRRSFLGALATSAVAIGKGAPPAACAATSHTFTHGAFEITILSDGNLIIPTPFLATNAGADELRAALAAAGQTGARVEPPCNVTLIQTPSDLVLVDVGAGAHFMPTAGNLMTNMQAIGISPESVTKIVYTHAHPDHIWGTLDDFDEEPNFPNASYVISAPEWDFWMADDVALKLPEDRQNFAPGAKRNLAKIKEKIRTITPGEDIVSGLRAVDTAGHTAGHIAIEVVSGNDALLVVGDALAHPVIAFEHPEWKPAADHHDAEQAIKTRKVLLDRLSSDRSRLIGYHLPYPGVGRVERQGTSYAYLAEGP